MESTISITTSAETENPQKNSANSIIPSNSNANNNIIIPPSSYPLLFK